MQWQTTPYTAIVVLAAALLCGFLAYVLRLRSTPRSDEALDYTALLLALGVGWLGSYAVRLSVVGLAAKSSVAAVGFALMLALPLAWLGYVMHYTGHGTARDRRLVLGILGAGGAALVALAVFNPWGVVYGERLLADAGSFVVLDVVPGPGYWLAVAYVYGMLVAASVLLASVALSSAGLIRWQSGVLLFLSVLPGVAGLVQLGGLSPVRGLNVAALSAVVTVAVGAVGVTRYGWMQVTPVPFTTLFETIPDPTFVVDGRRRVTALNRAAAEFFGAPRREVVGAELSVFAPALAPLLPAVGEPLPNGGVTEELELGDAERVYDVTLVPVRDRTGESVLVVCRDVTERAAARRELQAERERLDEFASVVSHDLRNPLTVAQGRTELAVETGDVDHAAEARAALDRMDALVSALLDLAREGQDIGETAPVPLDRAVRDAWDVVETEDATLDCDGAAGSEVLADGSRLRQLLENLFRNSVEHGSAGGPEAGGPTVRVGSLPDGGFYVADDGPGIPPADRETVLTDGDGIGLAVVRRVADAHGWDVDVTASASGGARFEVRT